MISLPNLQCRRSFCVFALFLLCAVATLAQQPVEGQPIRVVTPAEQPQVKSNVAEPSAQIQPVPLQGGVKLHKGDLVVVKVFGIPDFDGEIRVDSTGALNMPLVGAVMVEDLTPEQASAKVREAMIAAGVLTNPNVSLTVKESVMGVALMGEVARPGVYSPYTTNRLFQAISIAGGLTPRAGEFATIVHAADPTHPRKIRLPRDLGNAADFENVELQGGDTVAISRAGVVYVVGEVLTPAAFIIENDTKISVVKAIAMARGTTKMAALNNAKILRRTPDGIKEEPIQLKKIMSAKAPDVQLYEDDVLFVPASAGKNAGLKTIDSIVQITTGLAVRTRF